MEYHAIVKNNEEALKELIYKYLLIKLYVKNSQTTEKCVQYASICGKKKKKTKTEQKHNCNAHTL